MATATAKKTGFKESVKNTGTKVKNYANQKYQSAKAYGNKYKTDIRKNFSIFGTTWVGKTTLLTVNFRLSKQIRYVLMKI